MAVVAALAACVSCNFVRRQPAEAVAPPDTAVPEAPPAETGRDMHTVELPYGFSVIVSADTLSGTPSDTTEAYTSFGLYRDQGLIYSDPVGRYVFSPGLYPMVLQTDPDSFQLFFEMSDTLRGNYARMLCVEGYETVSDRILPLFIAPSADVNGDGIKEYVGFSDYGAAEADSVPYIPILYFSVLRTGIELDSTLTYRRNESVYGTFYGYDRSDKYMFPRQAVLPRLEAELAKITAAAP